MTSSVVTYALCDPCKAYSIFTQRHLRMYRFTRQACRAW